MTIVKGDFINGSAVVYKKENGWLVKGLVFSEGSILWLPYAHVGDFYCDRAVIDTGRGMGYIDRLGKEVIPPQFLVADDFSEERAFVSHGNDTLLIDVNGLVVASFPEPFVTGTFHNGTAIISRIVEDGEETEEAIIDRSGNFVVPFTKKRKITKLADIHVHRPESFWHEGIMKFSRRGKLGVRDKFGNELVNDFVGIPETGLTN